MKTQVPAESVERMWNQYWDGRSDAARNALIEHYLPAVRYAAIKLATRHGRRSKSGDVDDLLQYGVFGLRDAIRRFDPARGFKFESYCMQRVRGAMLDGLKAQQWVPREIRQRVTRYAAVQEELSGQEGQGLHEQAAAQRIGVSMEAIHELRSHASRMMVGSLQGEGEEEAGLAAVADHREEEAAETAQRQDVRELFFRELTRHERHLMMLYYYDNMTMREIGEVLGISGTRVSQLHTQIVLRLREKLAPRVTDDAGRVRQYQQL